MTSWQNIAIAQAISVTQGETVTLTLKLVNVGDVALQRVHVQLDPKATPDWIQSEVGTHQTVDMSAKSSVNARPSAMFPITFMVARQAPVNEEVFLSLRVRDGQGSVWTEVIRLEVNPRPKPKKSQLLQNYPNPFNPETWIPYNLKENANVKISIYNSFGQLVRTLDLGFKEADFHTSREKAAYWDGRNDMGEKVSSGLYFYHLRAGSFSQVRKMLILK
jgi:hypothetical protein